MDPIQPELIETMREIGHTIGRACPDGFGFCLFMFNLGDGGSMNYISNAQRGDMIAAMREFIARVEAEK